eukprot:15434780-Alexandrium_andersonii.AAC.1
MHNAVSVGLDIARTCFEPFRALSGTFGQVRVSPEIARNRSKAPNSAGNRAKQLQAIPRSTGRA